MTQEPLPEAGHSMRAVDARLHELIRVSRNVWRLVIDPRVPRRYKVIPTLAVLYLLSPLDLMPDAIPLLGQIDDLAVLVLAARLFVQLAEPFAPAAEAHGDGPHPTVTTTYRLRDE